jgi:TolB-like protein/Flp pilus assembly protein TadD
MTERPRAVFLSYASQDAEAARRICKLLQAGGIEVWFDQSELRGGDVWDRQIRKQIHDCAIFMPIISATTQERLEGYFRREWKLAVDRTHDMSERVAFLVPVVIDDTGDAEADVPEAFRAVQWTRLPRGETSPAFVNRISHLVLPGSLLGPAAQIRQSTGSSPSSRQGALSASWSSRPVLLLIATATALGIGYFAVDKLGLSKRAAATGQIAAVTVAAPVPMTVPEKSVAVLPFVDMSEKKNQEYFSDGLTEELIEQLSKIADLRVPARTSSFYFKDKSENVATIARELGVAHVLEGSVRKAGSRLRVTAELIRADSGYHLWSETYDRDLKDVFKVQDEIASAVVAALKLKLAPTQQSGSQRAANTEAHNEYLLARQFYDRGTSEGFRLAVQAYNRAITLDPDYAAAYAGLAVAEFHFADLNGDTQGLKRAYEASERAVMLGPNEAESYGARGFLNLIRWDWAGAQADFSAALALDPHDSTVERRYAELLANLGRLPEAIAAATKATELDPLSTYAWLQLGRFQIYSGDYAAAHTANARALEISPESIFPLNDLGTLQLLEGNARDALATFRKLGENGPFRWQGTSMAAHTLKETAESQQDFDTLSLKYAKSAAYQIAEACAWRGEKDKAFEWLERAYQQRDAGLGRLKVDPLLVSLRGDPRFGALLRKMKLPE